MCKLSSRSDQRIKRRRAEHSKAPLVKSEHLLAARVCFRDRNARRYGEGSTKLLLAPRPRFLLQPLVALLASLLAHMQMLVFYLINRRSIWHSGRMVGWQRPLSPRCCNRSTGGPTTASVNGWLKTSSSSEEGVGRSMWGDRCPFCPWGRRHAEGQSLATKSHGG